MWNVALLALINSHHLLVKIVMCFLVECRDWIIGAVSYSYCFYFFMKCFLKRIVLLPLLSSSSSIISPSVLPLSRQNKRPVILKKRILTSHHVCRATLKRVRYDHESTVIPPSTITSRCQPELGWAVRPCSPGDMWSCFTGTWRGGGFCVFSVSVHSKWISVLLCFAWHHVNATPFPDLCVDTISELSGHYHLLGKLQPLYSHWRKYVCWRKWVRLLLMTT